MNTKCTCPTHGVWMMADDIDRLVKEADGYLNGSGPGEATHPLLVDIVAQLRGEFQKRGPILAAMDFDDAAIERGAAYLGSIAGEAVLDLGNREQHRQLARDFIDALRGVKRLKLDGDARALWGIVSNAGRLARQRKARWSHVVDATGLGSTAAQELCRRFGFHPDEECGGGAR